MKSIKKIAVLLSPLLSFAILLIPYNWVNKHFIIDLFGCGCPTVDEFGNTVYSKFNANDFTDLFWAFISVCVTAISVFLSKRISRDKMWLRVLYIAGMILTSLLIAYQCAQTIRWK